MLNMPSGGVTFSGLSLKGDSSQLSHEVREDMLMHSKEISVEKASTRTAGQRESGSSTTAIILAQTVRSYIRMTMAR
jgi:hypothetical protein